MSQSSSDLDEQIQSGALRVLWVKGHEHSEPVEEHWSASFDQEGFEPEIDEVLRVLENRLSDLRIRCWYEESEVFMNNLGLEDELFEQLVESQSKRDDRQSALDIVMSAFGRHGAVWRDISIPQWFDEDSPDSAPDSVAATALVIDSAAAQQALRTLRPLVDAASQPDPRSHGTTICEYDYDSDPQWQDSSFSDLARAIDELETRSDEFPDMPEALRAAFEDHDLKDWRHSVLDAVGDTYGAVKLVESFPDICTHTDNGTDDWGRCPGHRIYVDDASAKEARQLAEGITAAIDAAVASLDEED